MVYRGFCDKQNKNYSVELTHISASAMEDKNPNFIAGRLDCVYAGLTDCCNSPSDCSILKNLNK